MRSKIFFYFFFLILIAPAISGFDCDYFSGLNKLDCVELNSVDENLIAQLIYTNTSLPDHDFISGYNSNILVNDASFDTSKKSVGVIKDAWISLFFVEPSIIFENITYVTEQIKVFSKQGYRVEILGNYYSSRKRNGATCKIIYSLNSQSSNKRILANNKYVGNTDYQSVTINSDSQLKAVFDVTAVTKERIYNWDRYCCGRDFFGVCTKRCYDCEYSRTNYKTDTLSVNDVVNLKKYDSELNADFTFVSSYFGTNKGVLSKHDNTSVIVEFNNSIYGGLEFEYFATFTEKPYYFLQLNAKKQESRKYNNLVFDNNTIYVSDASSCELKYYDFFNNEEKSCNYNLKDESVEEFEQTKFSSSWNLLFKIIIFIFINLLLFALIKKYWGKYFLAVFTFLMFLPIARAEESCGITNLASCIPQKMYDFIIGLLNAPLKPLLELLRKLLENPPNIDLFISLWAIMVYIISLFYGFLFIYSGFQFLFSGHNVVRREMAKEWLKNTVIMITLVQGSFYLYKLVLELASVLTSSVLTMVDEHFFLITANNIVNIGLEFFFLIFYVIVLFLTILLLTIRYLVVVFGVIFVPLGIFCYYIPPIRTYGKLILNTLTAFIFMAFIDAIIILACSMLLEIPIFQNIKILVMIACFLMIDTLFLIMILHALLKSFKSSGGDIAEAVKYIGMIV